MKPLALAEFILATYPDKNITPMKLQKLAYYAKVWTLVAGESLIEADFEKWLYGPVNTDIYHHYKEHGAAVIEQAGGTFSLDDSSDKLLKFILDNYVDYSAFTLSAMTHSEAPWQETAENDIIPDHVICAYYTNQPFAENFTQGHAGGPFHVLQSHTWHSFTMDMDKEEAETFAVYPSYDEFHQHLAQANDEFKALLKDINKLL